MLTIKGGDPENIWDIYYNTSTGRACFSTDTIDPNYTYYLTGGITAQYQHSLSFRAYDLNMVTDYGDLEFPGTITYINDSSNNESLDFNRDLTEAEINRLIGADIEWGGYSSTIMSIGGFDFNSIDTIDGWALIPSGSDYILTDTVTKVS